MKEYHLIVNGHDYVLSLKSISSERAEVEVDGKTYSIDVRGIRQTGTPKRRAAQRVTPVSSPAAPVAPVAPPTASSGDSKSVTAPIPGAILEIFVKEGDKVTLGQDLLKMEAMKMENRITAPSAGTVKKILVKEGDPVAQSQSLIEIQ